MGSAVKEIEDEIEAASGIRRSDLRFAFSAVPIQVVSGRQETLQSQSKIIPTHGVSRLVANPAEVSMAAVAKLGIRRPPLGRSLCDCGVLQGWPTGFEGSEEQTRYFTSAL